MWVGISWRLFRTCPRSPIRRRAGIESDPEVEEEANQEAGKSKGRKKENKKRHR